MDGEWVLRSGLRLTFTMGRSLLCPVTPSLILSGRVDLQYEIDYVFGGHTQEDLALLLVSGVRRVYPVDVVVKIVIEGNEVPLQPFDLKFFVNSVAL